LQLGAFAAAAGFAPWAEALAPASQPANARRDAAGPIAVGDRRQLFFDRRFIARSENVRIALNPPMKLGPVLKPDRPWEDFRFTSYFTTIQDGDLLRMYYSCFDKDQWSTPRAWEDHAFLCCAESRDGLHWQKPSLGLVEYNGSKDNNIILRSVVDGTVFIDPSAPPERRYKLLHTVGPAKGGLRVSWSADGRRFTFPGEVVSPWTPDSQQNAFYDPVRKSYLAYLRARPNMGLDVKCRSVARVEVKHIDQPWGDAKPQIVLAPDAQDPPDVDFYTNAAIKYPWADDAYFMFPAFYHHYPPEYGNDGLLDCRAAASRDGIAWQRPDRGRYVPLGIHGEWDDSFIMMGVGVARVGNELLQFYNGTDMGHGGTRSKSKEDAAGRRRWGWMGAVRQRLDGFYSADAAYTGGWIETPPLTFSGNRLVLNIDCSAVGSAKVAILDSVGGRALPGHGIDDCDTVWGNDLRRVVSWRGKSDLAALQSRAVALRIEMRSAKLFAFGFEAADG
jgi:hypothetical protein